LGAEAYSSGLANYDFLCTNLCSSLAGLVGAWAFKEADLVASCVKPGFPSPNKMEQKKMFVQAHLMIGMAQTNQQMYGTMNYVSVSFSNVDYYLFPMNDNGNIVLAVACVKPYSIEVISKAVSELIA
ncbi:MAG TPA: hypothetical protein VJP79_00185, partial [Nitrososphaera sp.]|nr:hypothetical protein [Nitrososphaera sp.]